MQENYDRVVGSGLGQQFEAMKTEKITANKALEAVKTMYQGSYRTRDSEQTNIDSIFPNGDGVKTLFKSANQDVSMFLETALTQQVDNCLSEAEARVVIARQMGVVYAACTSYVESLLAEKKDLFKTEFGVDVDPEQWLSDPKKDVIPKIFWHGSLQPFLLKQVREMTDEEIAQLFLQDNTIRQVFLDSSGQEFPVSELVSLKKIIRLFLEFHLIAKLSDPPCFFRTSARRGVRIRCSML